MRPFSNHSSTAIHPCIDYEGQHHKTIKSRISRSNPPIIVERESSLYPTKATSPPATTNVSDLDTLYPLATLRHVTQQQQQHGPYIAKRPFGYYSSIDLRQKVHINTTFEDYTAPLDSYDPYNDDTSFGDDTLNFPLPPSITRSSNLFATRSLDILPLAQSPPTYNPHSGHQSSRQYWDNAPIEHIAPRKSHRGRLFSKLRQLPRLWIPRLRSKMTDTAPPIPPRSEARGARPVFTLQPPFQMDNSRPMHNLAVDMPLPPSPNLEDTPSLSSGSSSDHESPNTPWSPAQTRKPSRESFLWGGSGHRKNKKSQDVSKDPYRIRDGAEKIPPSSGVYTPISFPGPDSISSQASDSGAQTPSGSTFRSVSASSTSSAFAEPSRFAFVRGKTLEQLKKVAGVTWNSSTTSLSPASPSSVRDSYLSSYSGWSISSRQSSLGPITPTSATRPFASVAYPTSSPMGGLGFGYGSFDSDTGSRAGVLPEHFTKSEGGVGSILFDDSGEIIGVVSPQSTPQAKGRRKPVPSESQDVEMGGLRMDRDHDEVHAM